MTTLATPNFQDKFKACLDLTRITRPIGTYLLLWPTLWALWIASDGIPSASILIIFTLGVLLTRSAGCVINDFADRNFDGHVKRTANRPLPTGRISSREALMLFTTLMLAAFVLVMMTNTLTILMSVIALLLASTYPFMKRHTNFPQVVLGAAYGWSIPMAFTAVQQQLPAEAWLMFAANMLWTIAYDTLYAMVDRDDDLKIGIKSTAVFFGRFDRLAVISLQLVAITILVVVGQLVGMGVLFYLGLAGACVFFAYQQWLVRRRERMPCFKAFLNNHWAEFAVLAGIIADYLVR